MIPDFRNFEGEGMRQLMHSAKGTTWTKKNAKYTDKVKTKSGKWRYIYGESGGAKTTGNKTVGIATSQLTGSTNKSMAKSAADDEVNRAKEKISQGTKKGKEDAMKETLKGGVGNDWYGRIESLLEGKRDTITVTGSDGVNYTMDRKSYLSNYLDMVKAGKAEAAKIVYTTNGYGVELPNDVTISFNSSNRSVGIGSANNVSTVTVHMGDYDLTIPVQETGMYKSFFEDTVKQGYESLRNQTPKVNASKSTINSVINNIKNKRESGSSSTTGRNNVLSAVKSVTNKRK